MNQSVTTRTGRPLHIGILGGGVTGLTAAFYLLRAGHDVTLLEARPQLGGLASYFNFGSFWWDKFYHCILTSDASLLQLIHDLDLESELRWTETKVGFFSRGKLYSMTTTMEFLRFPVLSIWNKLRLGLGIIYTSRIKDGLALEQEPIEPWLVRIFGKTNYERMWGPLLKCKLGSASRETSASFIWATIRRLYSTREKNASKKERLGYVRGGYRTVCARLLERIESMGGMVLTNFPVEQIRSGRRGRVLVSGACENLEFDRVISTLPSAPFAEITPELDRTYRNKLTRIQYMGMVCVVLVLRRKLTPYYCSNLIENLPFTGIIEMTNLISLDETNGRHLVYLPKYTSPGDPLFSAGDDEVWSSFRSAIQQVIPDLQEDDIERRFIFRERLVQPIPVLNYSQLAPEMQTPVPNLLLANTTQIVNSTLNNNEMVKIARSAVDTVLNSVAARSEEYAPPALATAQRAAGLSTHI